MRYASVCDGIGAVHQAWRDLPLTCAWRSEIDPFPEAVVAHRFPGIGPNLGDMTKITDEEIAQHGPIDLLVGGTPCQSFSVAGLRRGLADPRGNLALAYLALASRSGARWILWENVPGVLSSNGGRDFGAFLGGLAELGYGFAYRVLDARHFGVPQRRRRVFVVGHLGDWRRAAAVLFEPESLRGDLAAGGEEGEDVAAGSGGGASGGGDEMIPVHAHTLRAEGHDASDDGTGRGVPMVPMVFKENMSPPSCGVGIAETLQSENFAAVAFPIQDGREIEKAQNGLGIGRNGDPAYSLDTTGAQAVAFNWQSGGDCRLNPRSDGVDALQRCQTPAVHGSMGVRRLTPRECERLQGFPDDYTLVPYRGKPAADSPRYKALGNSMAVPVMRVIGERLVRVEALR